MQVEFANANVVIAARHLNPSVFNQLWLVDNEIVARDEFTSGCVFSEMIVNVHTNRFRLFVSPEQLQFVPAKFDEDTATLLQQVLVRIVQGVPHTPYTAVGLNFVWLAADDQLGDLSRSLFFRPSQPLYEAFNVEDARFGCYLSRELLGGRLKLEIKPATVRKDDDEFPTERLQFSFNLHYDIQAGTDAASQIEAILSHWADAKNEVIRLIDISGAER